MSRAGQFRVQERIKQDAPLLLVWSCIVLVPFGRIVEVPVLLMAALGAVSLLRHRQKWWLDPRCRLFTLVFLCVWVPVLASLPDAIEPNSTGRIALNHLRFFFAGIFVLGALRTEEHHRRFAILLAWLLGFWVFNGAVQWGLGTDLLGHEKVGARINALFGQGSLGYGLTLALLSPLLLEHARRYWPPALVIGVAVLVVCLVVLSGSRAAWIMLTVVGAGFAVLAWVREGRFPWRALSVTALVGTIVLGTLYQTSTWFESRVNSAVAALDNPSGQTNNSITHRLWIWGVAWRTFADNPINGVGARGFRHAYRTYTSPDDPYLGRKTPQAATHTHQLWLEMLSETGLIGVLGLLAAHFVLIGALFRSSKEARARMSAFGLCLVAAFFPFNTHMAIYSAFWSQLIWWLIAAYCAGADRSLGLVQWYLGKSPFRRRSSRLFR